MCYAVLSCNIVSTAVLLLLFAPPPQEKISGSLPKLKGKMEVALARRLLEALDRHLEVRNKYMRNINDRHLENRRRVRYGGCALSAYSPPASMIAAAAHVTTRTMHHAAQDMTAAMDSQELVGIIPPPPLLSSVDDQFSDHSYSAISTHTYTRADSPE
jgi:hypothetical protein